MSETAKCRGQSVDVARPSRPVSWGFDVWDDAGRNQERRHKDDAAGQEARATLHYLLLLRLLLADNWPFDVEELIGAEVVAEGFPVEH